MAKKLFSLSEARRTLPLVERIVADLLLHSAQLERLQQATKGGEDWPAIGAVEAKIAECLEELEAIGCSYKGAHAASGGSKTASARCALVDFPGRLAGRDVLWCWKSDETTISYYHGVDDGFDGRLRVPREALDP